MPSNLVNGFETLVLIFRTQNSINFKYSSALSQKLSEIICEMAQEIGGFKFEELLFLNGNDHFYAEKELHYLWIFINDSLYQSAIKDSDII